MKQNNSRNPVEHKNSSRFSAFNVNSNNPGHVRAVFDPYTKESRHIHKLQMNRSVAWISAFRMGVVR